MNNSSADAVDNSPTFNTSGANIAAAFFVAVLISLTLVGNIMVCVCFYCYRDLRTICNYFIISLSAADILVALLAMPIWLVLQLTDLMDEKSKTIFPSEVYLLWASVDILVGVASIMNLVAVSFDRHLAITHPFSYNESMTSFRAIVMIAVLWVFSFILGALRFPAEQNKDFLFSYQMVTVAVGFVIPLLLMIVMYMKIYFVARNQALRIGRNYAKDIKATKTIAIVIGAFVICWMPFFVIVIVFAIDRDFKLTIGFYKAIKWMEYLNSCLNPIIYTCLNRTYRRAFKKLLVRSSCCSRLGSSEPLNSAYATQMSFHKTKGVESLSHSSSSISENGNVCITRNDHAEIDNKVQGTCV